MNPRVTHAAFEPSEAEIQHQAYLLWLESGRQPGRDLDNWLAAKELLRHRHGRSLVGVRSHWPAGATAGPGAEPNPSAPVPG